MSLYLVKCADSKCCPFVLSGGFPREVFFDMGEAARAARVVDGRCPNAPHHAVEYAPAQRRNDALIRECEKEAAKKERRKVREALEALPDAPTKRQVIDAVFPQPGAKEAKDRMAVAEAKDKALAAKGSAESRLNGEPCDVCGQPYFATCHIKNGVHVPCKPAVPVAEAK